MIDEKTVDAILNGKMNPLASETDMEVARNYISRRVGTSRTQVGIDEMVDECEFTPGVWQWHDNSGTVFDVREK